MREIKFRVWDPNKDIMHNGIGISKISLYDFEGDNITEQEALQIMQFTGLNDKNDKEICEGDILYYDGHWNLYSVWDEENARFAFLCTDWVVTQGHPIQPDISSYTVIGNIYENPELLSGE